MLALVAVHRGELGEHRGLARSRSVNSSVVTMKWASMLDAASVRSSWVSAVRALWTSPWMKLAYSGSSRIFLSTSLNDRGVSGVGYCGLFSIMNTSARIQTIALRASKPYFKKKESRRVTPRDHPCQHLLESSVRSDVIESW